MKPDFLASAVFSSCLKLRSLYHSAAVIMFHLPTKMPTHASFNSGIKMQKFKFPAEIRLKQLKPITLFCLNFEGFLIVPQTLLRDFLKFFYNLGN